jgi:pimeloyl-ACP methyl ester carboxylesterase
VAGLATQSVGGGPRAAVLLHGFLGSGRNLRGLAQRWAAADPDRRLLLVDLTGHGASPPLPADADLTTVARDVDETARAAGAGLTFPVDVVGHSLGGRVALAWADAAPDAVASVTLLDIAPGPLDAARSASRRVLDVLVRAPAEAEDRRALRRFLVGEGLSAATADWLLMNVACDPAPCRWRIDRRALLALQDRVNAADLWHVVEARSVPVRAVRGGRSGYVTDDDARRLAAAGATVHTIEGAGHDLHVEAPEALLPLLPR